MEQTELPKLIYDPDFLDKFPAGIVILYKKRPVFINKKARKDLGLKETQKLSTDIFLKFLDPSERPRFLEAVKSDPLPMKSEWKALTIDGSPAWVQLRLAPLSNEYLMVIIRNIGKVKEVLAELSATEKQYRALIERAPNFLFIIKNGKIEYYNQAFIDKLGYSKEEIESRRNLPTFIVSPEHREKVARFLLESKRRVISGSPFRGIEEQYRLPDETSEFDLVSKDGSRVPVYAIVKRLYSGDKDYIIQGVLIDLSEINQLNAMKFDFLTLTQHCLRTPLANLKGHLDFYIRRIRDGIEEEDKDIIEAKLLDVFSRNIDRIVAIIDDLNDISAIRHGKLKCYLRGEDFVPILQQTIEDLQFLLHQYRIHIEVHYPSSPFVVNLDRNRIIQALRNVLENAIRFTGHGTIEITLSTTKSNEFMKLTIIDSGVGIDPVKLEDVGKPFMTFHPSASRLGLGLYLTKQIIEDHNGNFEIKSSGYGTGTSVTIELPLLISPIEEIEAYISEETDEDELGRVIKLLRSSQTAFERIEAIKRLGSENYINEDSDRVLKTLEQVILYDDERTVRNLAGQFYSMIIEKLENSD
ncbi:MAG: PAS domain-containing sensor histidine kinase [Candidatus Hodarchaeota archaeon]